MSRFRTHTSLTSRLKKNADVPSEEIYEHVTIDDDLPLSCLEITIERASENSTVPEHWHRSLEILLPEKGGTVIHTQSDEREVYPGDFALINSTRVHSLSSTDPSHEYHGYAIQISYPYLCDLIENFEEIRFATVYEEADRVAMHSLLHDLIRAYGSTSPTRRLLVRTALEEFLSILVSHYVVERETPIALETRDMIANVMHYMTIHTSEVFDAQKTADAMNLSYGYLARRFKEITGVSMSAYAAQLRIQKAERELLRKNQSVNEISDRCGFANVKSFEREFRRIHGMTPEKWKREHTV